MIEFKKISEFKRGTLYSILVNAYSFDSQCKQAWDKQWKEFDNFFYDNIEIADKYGFYTALDGKPIGHISWDPRQCPDYVIMGPNCILSEFKGYGFGKIQLSEAIHRIKQMNKTNKIIVTTNSFLVSAQKNYESVGFKKVRERNNTETPFSGNYLDYELIW